LPRNGHNEDEESTAVKQKINNYDAPIKYGYSLGAINKNGGRGKWLE